MQFFEQKINGLILLQPHILSDNRGAFSRVFCLKEFKKLGFDKNFVQANISHNLKKGTLRGLHFQKYPHQEAKLVKCITGSICDIVVDLRPDSTTFLQSVQVELSEENQSMLYIPEGCAHGFITLTDQANVLYHHTEYYEPKYESGLRFDDPALNLELPIVVSTISQRDRSHPLITDTFKGYL